jgi:hypothetical protein
MRGSVLSNVLSVQGVQKGNWERLAPTVQESW